MFERYNAVAQRVIVCSQEVARYREVPKIDAEHVLAGLLHVPRSLGYQVLAGLGVDVDILYLRTGGDAVVFGHAERANLPFTDAAKQTLHAATIAADQLGHAHVGSEHLLVGLLSVSSAPVTKVFGGYPPSRDVVMGRVAELTAGRSYPDASGPAPDPADPWALEYTMRIPERVRALLEQGRPDLAFTWAHTQSSIAEQWKDREAFVEGLGLAGLALTELTGDETAIAWLDRARAAADPKKDAVQLTYQDLLRARWHLGRGNFADAEALLQQVEQASDPDGPLLPIVAVDRIILRAYLGEILPVRAALAREVEQARAARNTGAEQGAWEAISIVETIARNPTAALDAARHYVALEERSAAGQRLLNRAQAYVGDPEARIGLEDGLLEAREVGALPALADALHSLGVFWSRRGNHGQAQTLLDESLEIAERIGHRPMACYDLLELADSHRAAGDRAAAKAAYARCVDLAGDLGLKIAHDIAYDGRRAVG